MVNLAVKELYDPDDELFTYTSETKEFVVPSISSDKNERHLDYFRFFGRLLAKIIIDKCPINLNLSKSVYKYLLNKKCILEDLQEIDPILYNSYVYMKDNTVKDVLYYRFEIDDVRLGGSETVELKPNNGKNIEVTDENKAEYIDLAVEYRLLKSIEPQLEAIKKGLNEILNKESLFVLTENDLKLLICGNPEIDVNDWENNTEYTGFSVFDDTIKWFWQAVRSFTTEQKTKLLQFSTGLQSVPFGGFSMLQDRNRVKKFNIELFYSSSKLPQSHTCFNTLSLPEYTSYEELEEKLLYAITEGSEGFGLA